MSMWNDETVSILAGLTAAGNSATEVARKFADDYGIYGVTRNMIIGKRWRMNMPPGMSKGLPRSEKRAIPPRPALSAKVKREEKIKREKVVFKRRRKLPGRLLFNLGFRGETM